MREERSPVGLLPARIGPVGVVLSLVVGIAVTIGQVSRVCVAAGRPPLEDLLIARIRGFRATSAGRRYWPGALRRNRAAQDYGENDGPHTPHATPICRTHLPLN